MQITDKTSPVLNKSAIVNVLLVYAIKFGGVDEGNKNAQLQQQVTGKSRVRGLSLLDVATPITTGIMIDAHAVLDVKIPITTMITSIRKTVRN